MPTTYATQKTALVRAVKTGDAEKIKAVCVKAVTEWNLTGVWPDAWSDWQCALDDVLPWNASVRLDDI